MSKEGPAAREDGSSDKDFQGIVQAYCPECGMAFIAENVQHCYCPGCALAKYSVYFDERTGWFAVRWEICAEEAK